MDKRLATFLLGLATLLGRPARAEDSLPPSIIHEACSQYLRGKAFDVVARFEDESQLFDPKVMYRSGSDSHWKQVAFVKDPAGDDFRATIKAKDLKGGLEYFIEVFDEFGNGPARMGSPEAPIRLDAAKTPEPCVQVPDRSTMAVTAGSTSSATPSATPPADTGKPLTGLGLLMQPPPPPPGMCEQADRPLVCEPLLWVTLGVVAVAAGGVGLYFVLKPDDKPPTPRKTVTIRVTGPDPTAVVPDP